MYYEMFGQGSLNVLRIIRLKADITFLRVIHTLNSVSATTLRPVSVIRTNPFGSTLGVQNGQVTIKSTLPTRFICCLVYMETFDTNTYFKGNCPLFRFED